MNDEVNPGAAAPAAAAAPRRAKTPPRILIVEDDAAIREINARVLARSGYEVDAAEDGARAWDILQSKQYDLVVTDNHMPKVTGIELIRKLHEARNVTPVIMATGALPQEELERQPWLQPAALLIKPYTFSELLGTVGRVLSAVSNVPILDSVGQSCGGHGPPLQG
jgi:DNA-binding response OmpR family regulator